MSITGIKINSNIDGNAFFILGTVVKAMKRNKIPPETIEEYTKKATSGDYNHLLAITTEYIDFV